MNSQFKIYKEADVVDARLAYFSTNKAELKNIVGAVVGAKNSVVLHDPITASGQVGYQLGTRTLRDVFMTKSGWKIDRTDNIESVYNAELGIKLIYQNVDSAADPLRDPRAVSGKGPATERMVSMTHPSLFPEWDAEVKKNLNSSIWFFCVSVIGDDVRAELSRPLAIVGGQFGLFIERIFIVQSGEWGRFDPSKFNDDDLGGEAFEVNVSRK